MEKKTIFLNIYIFKWLWVSFYLCGVMLVFFLCGSIGVVFEDTKI